MVVHDQWRPRSASLPVEPPGDCSASVSRYTPRLLRWPKSPASPLEAITESVWSSVRQHLLFSIFPSDSANNTKQMCRLTFLFSVRRDNQHCRRRRMWTVWSISASPPDQVDVPSVICVLRVRARVLTLSIEAYRAGWLRSIGLQLCYFYTEKRLRKLFCRWYDVCRLSWSRYLWPAMTRGCS